MKRSLIISIVTVIAAAGIFIEISYSAKSLEFAGGGIGQVNTSGMDVILAIVRL